MKKNLLQNTLIGVLFLLGSIASAQPTVNSISMDASSPDYSTNDDLTATYSVSGTVETVTAWYVDGVPLARISLPFEAGSTNALLDYSGRHNDLTTSGVPASEPVWGATVGHNGTGAFTFDGDDYLDAGTVFPRNSSYTKVAWVNISVGTGYKNILSGYLNADNNHGFKVNPNGRLNAGHSFGSFYVSDPDSLHNDVWYHVAVTFDYESGLMVLYKDGLEVARDIVPESNRSVTDNGLLVGSKTYDFFWNGMIDDAAVYSRDLTPEQIQALYTDRGDLMLSKETRGGENWRIRVTPFSASAVGSSRTTTNQLIEAPAISGLALAASSPGSLSTDDLTASYTSNTSVTETATAWFRDGNPDALLYLPFEGIDEALNDYSGSGNHATMVGNMLDDPTWDATAGHNSSGAFVYDGDDQLIVGDIFPLNSSYTKTAWIYNSGIFFGNIMSSDLHDVNNHTFRVSVDGHVTAGHDFGNATVRDPDAMSLDTWYFVAVTFDYTTGVMTLFRDGLEVHQATVDALYRDVVDPSLLIGSMNYQYNWTGRIDEAKLFDRELSPHQIFVMYNSGDNEIVSEETIGGEEWHAEVTPFSTTDAGATTASNSVDIHSVVVSTIADQTVTEGTAFSTFDLDDDVTVYEFTEGDLVWTSSGSTDLVVSIDLVTHVATVAIPDVDWYGSETIRFDATNPNGDSDFAEATFTVENANDAPVLSIIGGQITDEDVTLTGLLVEFTDADPSDSHTISVLSSDPNVSAVVSGNTSGSTYDLVPAANWHGSTQITVSVTDNGTGTLSDEEIYTLLVNPINDAPVLVAQSDQAVDEDNSLVGLSVVFSDADASDLHTISVSSDDSNVTIANLSGHISGSLYDLVPAADWNGTAEITVSVIDNGTGALSDDETFTFTVNSINDAPVLTDIGAQSTDEDINLTGLAVVFSDSDASDAHAITVVSSDANVAMANLSGSTSGSTYDLVPAASWNGTAQITVRVTDDGTGALSDFETYTFTVNAIDDAPEIAEIGDQNVDEDNMLTGVPVNFTDPETSDTHTINVVSAESNVVVANLNGHTSGSTYTLIPAANWNGTAQITVTVTQVGSTLADTEVYTLNVNPVNDAPDTIRLSNNVVDERVALETVIGLFSTHDIDMGDTHTYTFVLDGGVNDVDNDAFIIVGDTLKTNAEIDYELQSSYSILVQSDDGAGGTTSQNFTIAVNDIDETGVEDFYNNPSFNMYPVPAIERVTVEVDNPDNKELQLEIYSNTGRLVHAEPIYSKNVVDLTGFSDGMYVVRITGDRVYGTRKLIVKD